MSRIALEIGRSMKVNGWKRKPEMVTSKRAWGVVAACIVLLLSAGVFIPFRSIAWHCSHSSTVDVGQYGLRLPLMWWPSGYDGSELRILHATVFQSSNGDIRIFPSKDLATRTEPLDGIQWQEAFLEMFHTQRKWFAPVIINAHDTSLFCVEDRGISDYRSLICRVPGVAWGVAFSGATSDEQSAKDVLKTLYLRNK
jgi:hypothetical protein